MDAAESEGLYDLVVRGLSTAVEAGAAAHGWNLIGGVASGYRAHGYCADGTWMRTLRESIPMQGDNNGALHPNEKGHDFTAGLLYAAFVPSCTTAGIPRTPGAAGIQAGTTLTNAASAGSSTLEVGSTDGFREGDPVALDPNGPNAETVVVTDITTSAAPLGLAVGRAAAIVATSGSLTLAAPLQQAHAAGEHVVNVAVDNEPPLCTAAASRPRRDSPSAAN